MNLFRLKLETALNDLRPSDSLDWVLSAATPSAPGAITLPNTYVRLYHYTKVDNSSDNTKHQAAESLRQNGLQLNKARGSTYGEPNVVWASTELPSTKKVFAEFGIVIDDPRWGIGKPLPNDSPQEYESRKWDCYFMDSILPEEIIAVHEPWHFRYRYIIGHNLVERVRAGEFNNLLDSPEYAPAIYKILFSSNGP
jgi:hypothetical protein